MALLIRVFAFIIGALSFANLTWQGFDIPVGPIVGQLLTLHEFGFDRIFDFIEPLLIAVAGLLFDWLDINLQPHWKHFVTLSWLYIGADARNAWVGKWQGAKMTAFVRLAFGIPTALAAGAASGAFPDTSIHVAALVISGFVVYRFFYALRYAYERKSEGFSFYMELSEKLRITMQFALAGAAIVGIAYWVQTQPMAQSLGNVPLVAVYAAIAALIAYHLYLGWSNAVPTRRATESNFQSFWRQGNTTLSIAMAQAVLSGALVVALGWAGL